MGKLLPVDIALQPSVDVGRTLGPIGGVASDDEGYRFLGYSKRHSDRS